MKKKIFWNRWNCGTVNKSPMTAEIVLKLEIALEPNLGHFTNNNHRHRIWVIGKDTRLLVM